MDLVVYAKSSSSSNIL